MTDIRWKQRLSNLQKSLLHLAEAVEIEDPSMIQLICHSYFPLLENLKDKLEKLSHA